MKQSATPSRRHQRGSFLLEALVSVLIVAFGILGVIGLIGRSVQNIDDAKYRGEAAFLASQLIGTMWVSDRLNLQNVFDSTKGGAGYNEFKAMVDQRLPNATVTDPVVTVSPGPTPTSSIIEITIYWQQPGDTTQRKYDLTATVGSNT